ncbi:hypothetical protein EYF80_054265 [Liparis tanakae]|uniref:Uncharacterized protein n=1 Tax=Liparis tanakae TaxID=230148 RepID=A0A4Z2F3E8_9TELE|nr:hypothetical protein EYF80_054265 [Liparis tanakae]
MASDTPANNEFNQRVDMRPERTAKNRRVRSTPTPLHFTRNSYEGEFMGFWGVGLLAVLDPLDPAEPLSRRSPTSTTVPRTGRVAFDLSSNTQD